MKSISLRRLFGRVPKRRSFLAVGVAFALLAGFAALPAFAVHNIGVFELDGNATTGAHSGLPDDWDRVCFEVLASSAACSTATGVSSSNSGVTFDQEPSRSTTIFTGGGSKDDLNINPPPGPGGGWAWKNQGGLPDKDNLRDGFAARYKCDTSASPNPCTGTNNDSLLYFGADRFDNSGDAQIGFWFLQGDVSPQSDGTFGPDTHKAGDVLVLSDFTQGGGTPTIRIFAWDPTCTSGCNPATDLVNNTLLPLGGGTASPADCPSQGANDPFCAVVNNTTQTSPWTFKDKSNSTSFLPGEFYEGGINLTALQLKFPGLAGECFASFFSETRSSQSPDATLKDFIGGAFQPCVSRIETTPSSPTITLGGSVTDHAVVTGIGAGTPTGKVKFFICSPTQLDTDGKCSTDGTQVTGGSSNGDASGEVLTPVSGEPTKSEATSGSFTPDSTGTWCWRGTYVPAAGSQYKGSSDFATTECVNVINVAISTAQTFTVKDSATVTPSGPGATVGGTVRFRLYTTGDCSGSTLVDQTKTVSTSSSAVTVETTAVEITAHPTLSWLVEYTHTTGSAIDVTSSCGTENASLAIDNG